MLFPNSNGAWRAVGTQRVTGQMLCVVLASMGLGQTGWTPGHVDGE